GAPATTTASSRRAFRPSGTRSGRGRRYRTGRADWWGGGAGRTIAGVTAWTCEPSARQSASPFGLADGREEKKRIHHRDAENTEKRQIRRVELFSRPLLPLCSLCSLW